jgi:hypothetical protein
LPCVHDGFKGKKSIGPVRREHTWFDTNPICELAGTGVTRAPKSLLTVHGLFPFCEC